MISKNFQRGWFQKMVWCELFDVCHKFNYSRIDIPEKHKASIWFELGEVVGQILTKIGPYISKDRFLYFEKTLAYFRFFLKSKFKKKMSTPWTFWSNNGSYLILYLCLTEYWLYISITLKSLKSIFRFLFGRQAWKKFAQLKNFFLIDLAIA